MKNFMIHIFKKHTGKAISALVLIAVAVVVILHYTKAQQGGPTATNVTITGTPSVGQMLTGDCIYSDPDGTPQGSSLYRWYRDIYQGVAVASEGYTTTSEAYYTLTPADAGTTIRFEVTPVSQLDEQGDPVQSDGLAVPGLVGSNTSGGGITYGCKDPKALNYNAFSASKPSLCQYAATPTVTPPAPPAPVVQTTPASIFTANLYMGITNSEVKELQMFLNDAGYTLAATSYGSPGNETTYFGNLTRAALRKFQNDHGLATDGYLGPDTRKAVSAELAANPTNSRWGNLVF